MNKLPISACFMIKNEQDFLDAAIRSALPWASEIVVADTGSTDNSLNILDRLQKEHSEIRVFSLEWTDHFANTRNSIASQSSHNWVFFLDGDEVFENQDFIKLNEIVSQQEVVCFSVCQRNYCFNGDYHDVRRLEGANPPGAPEGELFYFDNPMERIFLKTTGLQYEGRIHESLLPACRRLGHKHQKTDILLHHYGRLKKTQSEKLEYYLKLAKTKLSEEPNNPAAWVELIHVFSEQQNNRKAFQMAQLAYQRFPEQEIVEETLILTALRSDAFSYAEKQIRRLNKQNRYEDELINATLYQGHLEDAEKLSLRILKKDPERFTAHIALLTIYFEKKKWKEAQKHLESALRQRPNDAFLQNAKEKLSALS